MEVEASSHVTCMSEMFDATPDPVTPVDVSQKDVLTDLDSAQKPLQNKNDSGTKVLEEDKNLGHASESTPAHPPVTSPANSNVGKYRLLRTIGKGNFAKVKLAIHMSTGVEVAIKIINKTVMDNTLLKRLKREITIMKVTNHPNIEIIENEDVLCLVMEYASGGEIFDYLVANGKMREKEARIKFRQLLSAIQYCHAKRIVHRDLKAENILLDQNLNVKVADFGLANTFEYDQRLTTFCGSPPYAAPELFLGIPYYGPGVDVWSLGVILFTLVLGHLPFDAGDLRELRRKILGLHYNIPRGAISPECEALLRKMLVLDPKDRSSLKVLMQDKWINMGYAPNEYLRPYKEPPKSQLDEIRVKAMEVMGFTRADLESSVVNPEFDHVYATYHLLPGTPSEFVSLCNEAAAQNQTSVVLSNSLVVDKAPAELAQTKTAVAESAATTNTTEIGRFTVAPSVKNAESVNPPNTSTRNGSRGNYSPADSNPATMNSKNHNDASLREHHSLTSTLPVALRKAILQVGRTFGGAGGTSITAAPNNFETVGRTSLQSTSSRSGKPSSKSNGGRNVITAAPVPIGAMKKPGFGVSQPSKRPSSNQHTVHTSSSAHSDSADSTSATVSASTTRPTPPISHAHMQSAQHSLLLKTDNRMQSVSLSQSPKGVVVTKRDSDTNSSKSLSTQSNRGKSAAEHAGRTSVALTDPQNGKVLSQTPSRNSNTVAINGLPRPISSSSASSDSCGEREVRETAAMLVQNVWRSVDPSVDNAHHIRDNSVSENGHKSLASTTECNGETGKLSNNVDFATEPRNGLVSPEVSSLRSEKPEISRSFMNITDQTKQLDVANWSTSENKESTGNTPSVPQIKVLHTVQGNEALALREQAIRLQSANATPVGSGVPVNFTIDSNHQSSWSRGVLRALGGLFVQNKSPDVRTEFVSSPRPLNKPREVRFPWSVHTTSTKTAEEVLRAIIHALEVTPGCRYAYDPHLPFLLQCSWAADRGALKPAIPESDTQDASIDTQFVDTALPAPLLRGDPVHWEMEVCQLPRVHLRGVRLKRIRGSTLHFRPIADLVMKSLRL